MERKCCARDLQSRNRGQFNSPLPRLPGAQAPPISPMDETEAPEGSPREEEGLERTSNPILSERLYCRIILDFQRLCNQYPELSEELSEVIRNAFDLGRIEERMSSQDLDETASETSTEPDEENDRNGENTLRPRRLSFSDVDL